MSMIYCERHDIRWDSDKKERCPQCEVDNMDIVDELLAALEAMLTMMDAGPSPRKLDDAITWRQNDEKAKSMAKAAIAKAKEGQT